MKSLNNIKNLMLATAIACSSLAFTACNDDDPALPGNGIESAQWTAVNDVDIKGQTLIFEFDAPAPWAATTPDEDWVHILTESGPQGVSSLRVKVDPNDGIEGRTSQIALQLQGYAEPCIISLRQGDGILEKGDGRYREVNKQIYDYMAERYLWNDSIASLKLDYTIDYQKFLDQMLTRISEFDDCNHEDGHWTNGQREDWYSYIESSAPLSKAVGQTNTDSGLLFMGASIDTNEGNVLGLAVIWCTPGSPADEEGLKRGHFIKSVNNIEITMDNYRDLGSKALNGNCTLEIHDIKFNSSGIATLTPVKTVYIGKHSYVDPSIYTSRILSVSGGKKVGYINYMGFYMDFDSQLIDVFRQFKEANVDDVIIDLRYNNGGHVLSSTVLGTLVAGSAHKGEIYVRTTYNKARSEAGEIGEYRIGEPANPEAMGNYDKISDALTQSLGLNKVYVITTTNTASASELVINGLRGLGLTVNTIGLTTNGKNVGMEGTRFVYRNYDFYFYPITFYCENAMGFKDYSNGFVPGVEFDDSNYYPCDFGTEEDPYTNLALQWIVNGSKPSVGAASRSTFGSFRPLPSTAEMREPLTRRIGGNIQLRDI